MHFRVFFKVKVNFFEVAKISNIFLECLKFLIYIFLGGGGGVGGAGCER